MEMLGQVGLNLQDGGTGFSFLLILELGKHVLGLANIYYLLTKMGISDFGQRVDLKARFNANLGYV
jgi:hypothetical protein